MNKLKIFAFFLTLLFVPVLFGQQSITWQRIYDTQYHMHNYGYSICKSTENTFFIAGYALLLNSYNTSVIRINIYGDTLWTFYADSANETYSVTSSDDGGCVFTGAINSFPYAAKLDSNGNTVWEKTYNVDYTQIKDIKKTSDNGYIMCGWYRYNIYDGGLIIKIDSLGNETWKVLLNLSYRFAIRSIIEDISGNYIATGGIIYTSFDSLKGIVLKVNSNGNIIWNKEYKILNNETYFVKVENYFNNYILFGEIRNNQKRTRIFTKIDTNGNILQFKEFQSQYDDFLTSAAVINNNKFIFSQDRAVLGGYFANVFIADTSGNIIKEKTYPINRSSTLYSILPLLNGYILLCGYSRSLYGYGNNDDVYVIRTDSTLEAPIITVKNISNLIPDKITLYQNYPNPFNNYTRIIFEIPAINGLYKEVNVRINIYNIIGQKISKLIDENFKPGKYEVIWNSKEKNSGLYLLNLVLDNKITKTIKMIFLK
jgi:hypothetical protein